MRNELVLKKLPSLILLRRREFWSSAYPFLKLLSGCGDLLLKLMLLRRLVVDFIAARRFDRLTLLQLLVVDNDLLLLKGAEQVLKLAQDVTFRDIHSILVVYR